MAQNPAPINRSNLLKTNEWKLELLYFIIVDDGDSYVKGTIVP